VSLSIDEPHQLKILLPISFKEVILPGITFSGVIMNLNSLLILTFVQVTCKPVSLQLIVMLSCVNCHPEIYEYM